MALKKKKGKSHLLEIGLNITSLIDVLTVLIFFLIKSMTVSAVVVSLPADLNVPKTTSETPLVETVSVAISKSELRLNNDLVLKLENGSVEKQFFDEDKRTIKPLKESLVKLYKEKFETQGAKIIIQADKDLPFHLVQFLLHTAAVSGFTDYQFVVAPK